MTYLSVNKQIKIAIVKSMFDLKDFIVIFLWFKTLLLLLISAMFFCIRLLQLIPDTRRKADGIRISFNCGIPGTGIKRKIIR